LNELSNPLQIWYRDGRRTPLVYGTQTDTYVTYMGVAWVTWPDFEILGPLLTFEQNKLSASNLVQRWRTDPTCIRSVQCLHFSERFLGSTP